MGGADEILLPEKAVDEVNSVKVFMTLNIVGALGKFSIFCNGIRASKKVFAYRTAFRWSSPFNVENKHVLN